jgi:membrane protease YdiL (CAAX protease family)
MRNFFAVVGKFVIFFMGAISWVFFMDYIPDLYKDQPALNRLWWEFIPLVGVILVTFIFIYAFERWKKANLFKTSYFTRDISLGLILGFGWIALSTFIIYVNGSMEITGQNKVNDLYIWIIAVFLNAAMQELLIRGYLYQMLKRTYNTFIAILVTTALFTFLHGGAFEAGLIPILNLIAMSVFVSTLLEYTGNLIAPILVHFIWNTIGALILGSVSLVDDYPSLFNSTFDNSLIGGNGYGLEGSIITLTVSTVFAFCLFLLMRKRRLK